MRLVPHTRIRLGAMVMAFVAAAPIAAAAQVACEADTARGTAVLTGSVRDTATAFPLQGAGVAVRWTAADGRTAERKTETDPDGEFRVCDVPARAVVSVHATWYGERSEARSADLGAGQVRVVLAMKSPLLVVGGLVIEADGGAAVPGATVRIRPGPPLETDAAGAFRFDRIPPGVHEVTAERIGFAAVRDTIVVELGLVLDLTVRLSARAVPLEPITVIARSAVLLRTGFYLRQGRGLGSFITRQQIESRPTVQSSDLLRRIPGVRLVRGRFGDQLAVGRGNCPYRFIIDGARINAGFSIDEMPPHWFEGIEVYNGPSQVPIEFSASPSEPNAACGLIVIWTRNRG